MASVLAMPAHQALLNPAGILFICTLINQNDSGLSVGSGNPHLPLISHSGGSWLSNIGFTVELWGMSVCGHK